jgi:hypothetical protein
MKRHFSLSVLLCMAFRLISQEVLFEKNIDLEWLLQDKRESYPVINPGNGNLALFILDNNSIMAHLFDANYRVISELRVNRPKNTFSTLLGGNSVESKYNLFFTNVTRNAFCIKTLDLTSGNFSDVNLPLSLKDETLLETVSYKNQFYLLTVKKNSSLIKVYVFDSDANYRVKELDFSGYTASKSGYPVLFDVLTENIAPFKMISNVSKIDNSSPVTLDLTSRENKLYVIDGKVFLTIDNDPDETKILTFSLEDFQSAMKINKQVKTNCDESLNIKANSYLYNNCFFQIKGCSEELHFSVYDFLTDSLIRAFKVIKDEEIAFKNSPLYQEGGSTAIAQGSKKELENSKQILKKIAASHIGIAVYQTSDALEITLGGQLEVQGISSGSNMVSAPGTSISTPYGTYDASPGYSYNPTMNGYSGYTNKRSAYFISLLNVTSFDHMPGEVKKNAFDRINDFTRIFESSISSETVFKAGDYYVLGYYNALEKKYYLRKFTDQ